MSMENVDVVVVGSLIMDLICYADRIPKLGETIEGSDFKTGFGGKGANQCVAASRLGANCAFIGKVGNDAYGTSYYNNMKSEKINVECVEVINDVPTGVASIMVGSTGENIILIVPGANKLVTPKYVQKNGESLIKRAKVVIIQLEIPTESSLLALKLAKMYGAISIFNVAPAVKNLPLELFSLTDILCLNETEAELITGMASISSQSDAEQAIKLLLEHFHCNSVVITLGSSGAVLWDKLGQQFYHVNAPKVKAVDTTGAGDCFVGTMAYCISKGESLHDALKQAVLNASDSVLRKGTQSSFPSSLIK